MKNIIMTLLLFTTSNLMAASFSSFDIGTFIRDPRFDSFNATATVYNPSHKPKAALILYPTISGVTPLESNTAKYFAKRGYLVIVPHPVPTEIMEAHPNVEKLDNDFFKPSVAALKLLEHAEERLNLDTTTPLFALGASQGGIRTIALSAYSGRIKAAWFAVAGGNFPHIYAYSKVEKIAIFRENQMRDLGIKKIEDYEQFLKDHLKNDPLNSCPQMTIPFVQVIALEDTKVPTVNQIELARACPEHKIYRIKAGHFVGSISIYFKRHEILEFFESKL